MKADYHVHTSYSDDSIYPMEDVVKDAIALGLDEICFTDHVDYGIKYDWNEIHPMPYRGKEPLANVDYPAWYNEIQQLKDKYKDQITLKIGLEFGIQYEYIDRYEKLFKQYPFDFILLSIHEIDNQELWTQDFQKTRTQVQYNLAYYKALLKCMKAYKNYSVLAHLDLITRYDNKGPIAFSKIEDVVAEVLKQAIKDDKGIELNTSFHRYKLQDTTPSKDILKLYKDLGGKIITIGSDSHRPDHLGAYIDEGKELLKSLGYKEFCTFERMKPIYHSL